MAFRDHPDQQGVQLLQRSLERARLGHAYLFTGHQTGVLQEMARTLAQTLNCQEGRHSKPQPAGDCCDRCPACQRIGHDTHPDVHWVRPESKTRVIKIEQMRELMQEINLKPTEAEYKVCIVVDADRLNDKAANAFLKTLEEPPARSVLILLTTEPQRMLETIVSRCLRLSFSGDGSQQLEPAQIEWLTTFSGLAATEQKSLLGRYRLMDVLVQKLNELKSNIETSLKARSPLEQYQDAEKEFVEKWEDELAAAVESEYRRQRIDLLVALQWWLRDVWVMKVRSPKPKVRSPGEQVQVSDPLAGATLLNFPQLPGTTKVAGRITAREALENLQVMEQLQRWLGTNVQEALALEVGLLKLKL